MADDSSPTTPTPPAAPTPSGVSARPIESEMRQSFLDYAMSVIVARALPDARDGLKPVHRRILYAMSELGMGPGSAYKKSARVVGEVLGKYHPHGDSAVYEAMVRMAQDWSLRYPLVDGQGNFGSVDGDSAAAMRYTESRLSRITLQLLEDLDKETVGYVPNFDATLQEPEVLPAAIPNLLINGSAGIAVGMATNVPPHNLGEIVDATVRLIDHPDADVASLLEIVKGPDFPTGGIIHGRGGILNALTTGRGKIVVRGKHAIESMGGDRERIIFTEIPYQVNKSDLIIKMAELAKEKVVEGISDLRDESDRRGMRIVIELKRDAISDVVLNQLFKHTDLQATFAVNNLALVDGRPRTMGLKQLLEVFLKHRFVVVTKRTEFELKKAEARAHLLEGLLIALANIDAVVALIRASADPETALGGLMARFGLSEIQGKAILDMRLQRLTSLETEAVRSEHAELVKQIAHLKAILADPKLVYAIIREELLKVRADFADKRRTQLADGDIDIDDESLIPEEESVFLLTRERYVKRMPLSTWREQRRGGRGRRGMKLKGSDTDVESDAAADVVVEASLGSTHDWVCFFTNRGRVYRLKGYQVPTGSANAKGKPIANLLALEPDESVQTIIPVRDFDEASQFLVFATRLGRIKRTALSDYKNIRENGIYAVILRDGDELLEVHRTDGASEIILATRNGQACRFEEGQVRVMGRQAGGVRGIRLRGHESDEDDEPGASAEDEADAGDVKDPDEVVSLAVVTSGMQLLSVTERGYGKRTPVEEYRKTRRGGTGVRTIAVNERNGKVVSVRPVHGHESLLAIMRSGVVIRTGVDQIRETGRGAQGVRVVSLDGEDAVIQVVILPPDDEEEILVAEGGSPPAAA
ncbi:MAG: gyrase subunit [Thermoplasmata archaeon]|nr:gyrase subunit [Thermoplasmata archaeon]